MPNILEELDMKAIGTRVFNNESKEEKVEKMVNGVMSEVVYNDDELLRAYCRKVFPKDGTAPDPSTVWKFNNIMLELAENLIVKPNINQFLDLIAITKQLDANVSLERIKIERDYNIKWTLVAQGSGVRTVKLGSEKSIAQIPFTAAFGVNYDPLTKTDDEVEWYRRTVKDIGRSKINYIFKQCFNIIKATGALPTANVYTAAGLNFSKVKDLARTIQRRTGSKAVLLADQLLLDSLATKMLADTNNGGLAPLLYDGLRAELFANMAPTNFGTFIGLPMENRFTDDDNTKYQFDTNEGIMVGSGDRYKALQVSLIGNMVQRTHEENKDNRYALWVEQEMAITLLYPNRIGLVIDTSTN